MDMLRALDLSNGGKAARFAGGRWTWMTLPKPAEKTWAACFWAVDAVPARDDFVLKQICQAPNRELAYALFTLTAASDELVRIPFDNAVFDPARSCGGASAVEDDGTLDLGSGSPTRSTLARYDPARGTWKVVERGARSRLSTWLAAHGPHVLWSSGFEGEDLSESSDGGETWNSVQPVPGMAHACNAAGCTFISAGGTGSRRTSASGAGERFSRGAARSPRGGFVRWRSPR